MAFRTTRCGITPPEGGAVRPEPLCTSLPVAERNQRRRNFYLDVGRVRRHRDVGRCGELGGRLDRAGTLHHRSDAVEGDFVGSRLAEAYAIAIAVRKLF